jgi:hypothetical protein
MQALHVVLKAHYGNRPAGHWVVFETTISEVKLICSCVWMELEEIVILHLYRWINSELHDKKYLSSFEDNFGNIVFKVNNCPKIAHFLYNNPPLIDEANKQQNKMVSTLKIVGVPRTVGSNFTDMHQCHLYKSAADAATFSNLITSIREPEYDPCLHKLVQWHAMCQTP